MSVCRAAGSNRITQPAFHIQFSKAFETIGLKRIAKKEIALKSFAVLSAVDQQAINRSGLKSNFAVKTSSQQASKLTLLSLNGFSSIIDSLEEAVSEKTVLRFYVMKDKNSEKTTASENEKILVSFYLSPKMLEEVDDFIYHLKKSLPVEKRRKMTKSLFYEASLKVLVQEYRATENEDLLLQVIRDLMGG